LGLSASGALHSTSLLLRLLPSNQVF